MIDVPEDPYDAQSCLRRCEHKLLSVEFSSVSRKHRKLSSISDQLDAGGLAVPMAPVVRPVGSLTSHLPQVLFLAFLEK